jgi:hypothetical protein
MSLHIREQGVDWLELSRAARICRKVGLRRPLRALGLVADLDGEMSRVLAFSESRSERSCP